MDFVDIYDAGETRVVAHVLRKYAEIIVSAVNTRKTS